MRLDRITIERFLSFDSFEWAKLDPRLNLIVGPNGSGKTNLFHALSAIQAISTDKDPPSDQAIHRRASNRSMKVTLDITFSEEWEQRLLTAFVAASFCDEQPIYTAIPGLTSAALAQFSSFVSEKIRREAIRWMFAGRLVAAYDRIRWSAWYEVHHPEFPTPFHLLLGGRNGLFDAQSEFGGTMPPFQIWKESLSGERLDAVQGFLSGRTPFRGFPDLYLPSLLSQLINKGSGMQLGVQIRPSLLATYQELEQAIGSLPLESNKYLSVPALFELILGRSWVFTENVRRLPYNQFALTDLQGPPIDLSNADHLALHLFRLRSGSPSDQEHYHAIQKTFHEVTGRQLSFDVRLADARSIARFPAREKPLLLDIPILSDGQEIPLEFSGAGIAEALFLSTLLAGAQGQVILLDEPALNVHPTMQAALLKAIRAPQTSNQFFIVTHSPFLVPSEALSQVCRFFVHQSQTVGARLDTKEIDADQFARLEKALRHSTDMRGMLFSRAAILFEGDTELGALPVWFEQKYGYSLESRVVALFNPGGDTGFETSVRFLKQFAIPWVIVCDGLVFDPPPPKKSIREQLEKAGVSGLPTLDSLDFPECRQALAPFGVLTLANSLDEKFESLPIVQQHHKEADRLYPRSKALQGRYIAEQYPSCPPEVASLFEQLVRHLGLDGA